MNTKSNSSDLPSPVLVGRQWIFPDGTTLPLLSGGSDEGDTDGDTDPVGGESGGKTVTFTEAELAAKLRDERRKAKGSVDREIKSALGVDDLDEVKQILSEYRNSKDKEKSEIQKAQEEHQKAAAKAQQAEATAAALLLTTSIEKELIRNGVSVDAAERLRRLIDLDAGADADAVKAEVAALKADMPHLFNTPEGEGSGPKHSNPGFPPRQTNSAPTSRDKARNLLHERHPNLRKS